MINMLMLMLSLAAPAQDRVAAVDRALEDWVEMWNSYDLDEVDRLFVADESVTYFSSEYEGLIEGIGSIKGHHVGFGFRAGGALTGSRLWLEDVEVRWADGTAVVVAQWLFARPDAEEPPQKGPVSFVLVAGDDGYRILHAHFANAPAGG